jgi:hypothetical protein
MTARRLLLYCDPELDGAFRRRLERALDELQIAFADADEVDADPDASRPASLAAISAAGRFAAPGDADFVLLAGPGEFPSTPGALRLETSDIDARSRRWTAVAEKLGAKLDRPGLGKFTLAADVDAVKSWALTFPADPLARDAAIGLRPQEQQAQLAAERQRAETAERALADLERERSDAIRQGRQSDQAAGLERARVATLQREVERLTALLESTAFALAHVRADCRVAVTSARDHAWQARLAAARSAASAEDHPDALVWTKASATYSGETRNRQPHGFGVIAFRAGASIIATYSGGFIDGVRAGHGVATSDGGHVWCGEFADGEASGFGLLETPDGRRFEGEVRPDESGAPLRVQGWTWEAPGEAPGATPAGTSGRAPVHSPLTPLLPPPDTRAAGG